MKTTIRFGAVVLAAAALVGCKETTSSEFIRTGGIAALMSVTGESADSSTVHVELRVGGDQSNTYVVLDGGDRLFAKAGDETVDLHSVAEGVYEGEIATGAQVEFTVSLDRVEDDDALNSRVTLPAHFEIAQPQPNDELSRADDGLFITWTPAGNLDGTVDLSGTCINSRSYSVNGNAGMLVVGPGDIESLDEMMPETCNVDITIAFQREGTADPAFDDESYFRAYQERRTSFLSAP